jgi:propionyl-CoA carboxylase alpha chain
MPELIQCRINNTVPNLELSYRGIKLSALILPKHVANYNKYMKPIKIIDKSNLLLCPMPGKLIKVLVKEGDTIEEGQALCVVEAMKMENTLLAEKKCIINKINFVEGDTVSVDKTIMELNFEK